MYKVALQQTLAYLYRFCINTFQRLAYLRLVGLAIGDEVFLDNANDVTTDMFQFLLDLPLVLPDKVKLFRLQFFHVKYRFR